MKFIQIQKIEVVSIASYDQFHYEQICNSLENDKHVFVKNQFVKMKNNLKRLKVF